MVMRFGMSERLGPRVFGHDRSQPFLGREFSSEPDYSDEIAREIDDEIRRIVEEAHQTAKDILIERREGMDRISKILLERETIDAEQFEKLLEGAPEDEVFGERRGGGAKAGARAGAREGRQPGGPAPRASAAPRVCRRRRGRVTPTSPSPLRHRRRRGLESGRLTRMHRPSRLAGGGPLTRLMGIVNVTPDSFSDGGRYLRRGAGDRARGGRWSPRAPTCSTWEASRPVPARGRSPPRRSSGGSSRCSRGSTASGVPISIDTSKAAVAEVALDAGAEMVNDVTALRADPELAAVCAERGCGVVLMHMQGTPAHDAGGAGVRGRGRGGEGASSPSGSGSRRGAGSPRIGSGWIPGSGSARRSSTISSSFAGSSELRDLGRPIVVGTSRKSFIGTLTGREVGDRLGGTIASNVLAVRAGADVLRVHDVAQVREAVVRCRGDPGARIRGRRALLHASPRPRPVPVACGPVEAH